MMVIFNSGLKPVQDRKINEGKDITTKFRYPFKLRMYSRMELHHFISKMKWERSGEE